MISSRTLALLLLLACTSFVVAQNAKLEEARNLQSNTNDARRQYRLLNVGTRPVDETDDELSSSKGTGKAGGKAGSKKSGSGKAGKAGAKKSGEMSGKAGKAGAKKSGEMSGRGARTPDTHGMRRGAPVVNAFGAQY